MSISASSPSFFRHFLSKATQTTRTQHKKHAIWGIHVCSSIKSHLVVSQPSIHPNSHREKKQGVSLRKRLKDCCSRQTNRELMKSLSRSVVRVGGGDCRAHRLLGVGDGVRGSIASGASRLAVLLKRHRCGVVWLARRLGDGWKVGGLLARANTEYW